MQKSENRLIVGTIALLLLTICGVDQSRAQTGQRYTLSGVIMDASTRDRLPYVNVFLASTALGAVTDTLGRFSISRVPAGAYDLIISSVGYEREIRRVEIQDRDVSSIRIALKEKVIEETAVEIVGDTPSIWNDRLKTFEERLFGTTRNGSECRIVNPEVLEFTVDDKTGRFEATSSAPLTIENNALGYRFEFIIRIFVIEEKATRISGWTHFKNMEASDEDEIAGWQEERLRAYNGSLRHFLAALVNGTFREEGFRVSLVKEISLSPQMSLVPESKLKEQILTLGFLSFERRLSFEDYLKVDYLHEFQEGAFVDYWEKILDWGRRYQDRHQFSWLRLVARPAMLSSEGLPYDSSLLETYGYWAYERVGEWLPLEYRPPQ